MYWKYSSTFYSEIWAMEKKLNVSIRQSLHKDLNKNTSVVLIDDIVIHRRVKNV